jgi:CBS-domain-containing membrane protein
MWRDWSWVRDELGLALPPTIVVLVAFFTTQSLTNHLILFASLASSAFLVYREPAHRMNRLRTMILAQLTAWAIGLFASMLIGAGYAAGAAAMVGTIVVLVALDIVHPPAISTALGFSVTGPSHGPLFTFLLALAIVSTLAVLQKIMVSLLDRIEGRSGMPDPPSGTPG